MEQALARICEQYFVKSGNPKEINHKLKEPTEDDLFFQELNEEFCQSERFYLQSQRLDLTGYSIVDNPNECII